MPSTAIRSTLDQLHLSPPISLLQPQVLSEPGGRCSGNFGFPHAVQVALCPTPEIHHLSCFWIMDSEQKPAKLLLVGSPSSGSASHFHAKGWVKQLLKNTHHIQPRDHFVLNFHSFEKKQKQEGALLPQKHLLTPAKISSVSAQKGQETFQKCNIPGGKGWKWQSTSQKFKLSRF